MVNVLYRRKVNRLKKRIFRKERLNEYKSRLRAAGSSSYQWLWEFSKRLVVMCALFYFVSQLFSMGLMLFALIQYADISTLSIFITEANETFRVVVAGYALKAGFENVGKIVVTKAKKEKKPEAAQPEQNDIGSLG